MEDYYATEVTVCKKCEAGQIPNTNKNECEVCPDNQYETEVEAGKCLRCKDGKVNNADHTDCIEGFIFLWISDIEMPQKN